MDLPPSPVTIYFFMDYSEDVPFNRAALEPFCCFYYIADIFAIWLHGLEKLRGFPNQLNGIRQNI
jgi:hypothetical protein